MDRGSRSPRKIIAVMRRLQLFVLHMQQNLDLDVSFIMEVSGTKMFGFSSQQCFAGAYLVL